MFLSENPSSAPQNINHWCLSQIYPYPNPFFTTSIHSEYFVKRTSSERLLQIGAGAITNHDNFATTNWDRICYKLGQVILLQICWYILQIIEVLQIGTFF